MIHLILLILSFVLFGVAAFGVGLPRVHLGWLAAAFFILAILLSGVGAGLGG